MTFEAIIESLCLQLSTIFKNFVYTTFDSPTVFLDKNISKINFGNIENKYNKIFDLTNNLIFSVNKTGFILRDGLENTIDSCYCSISLDRTRKMYIYSVKSNEKIRGRALNKAAINISKTLGIKKIFIYDNASVNYNNDPNKVVNNFSIWRILEGKKGFYEDIAEFENKDGALIAKNYLIKNLSESCQSYECVVDMIEKALEMLWDKSVLFNYIARL